MGEPIVLRAGDLLAAIHDVVMDAEANPGPPYSEHYKPPKLPPSKVLETIVPGASWQHASFETCPVTAAGYEAGAGDAPHWAQAIDLAVRKLVRRSDVPLSGRRVEVIE